MAIAITEPVAEVASTTNTTSYSTGSFTPSANSLLVLLIFATGTVSLGTVSGLNLQWVRNTAQNFGTGNTIYCFWAKVGDSPATGTVTFDCSDDSASGCFISVHEYTGHDAYTRNPIRQTVTNSANSTNANGTFSQNLITTNGYSAAWSDSLAAGSSTPPTGWTENVDAGISTPTANFAAAYRAGGETGTNISFTNALSGWGFIGIEVYVDGTGPRPTLATLGVG